LDLRGDTKQKLAHVDQWRDSFLFGAENAIQHSLEKGEVVCEGEIIRPKPKAIGAAQNRRLLVSFYIR